jgi:hypothetical protein
MLPHPGAAWYCTSATIVGALTSGELTFERIVSDADIDRFGWSIGRADWVKSEQRQVQMVVRRDGVAACVGCGHFVFTVAREAMHAFPRDPCGHPLGGGTDEVWYDRPPDRSGYWRLSTPAAYACHMGNVPEPWMEEELQAEQPATPRGALVELAEIPPRRRPVMSRTPWAARELFIRALRRAGVHSRAAEQIKAAGASQAAS